jgi:hypothetical protein
MPSIDFNNAGLREIMDHLQGDYYAPISSLLTVFGDRESLSEIMGTLNQFLILRRETLLPYLTELDQKTSEKHDCAGCTGKCHLGHGALLMELAGSHDVMRETIFGSEFPSEYHELRNLLAATILIESTYLLPAIALAQKAINVPD